MFPPRENAKYCTTLKARPHEKWLTMQNQSVQYIRRTAHHCSYNEISLAQHINYIGEYVNYMQTWYKDCHIIRPCSGAICFFFIRVELRFALFIDFGNNHGYYLSFGIYLSLRWNLIKLLHFVAHSLESFAYARNAMPPHIHTEKMCVTMRLFHHEHNDPIERKRGGEKGARGRERKMRWKCELSAIDFCQSHFENSVWLYATCVLTFDLKMRI